MSTGRRGSRSPIVMPSSELDAHLHSKAALITKNRTSKVAWNFAEDEPVEEDSSNGYHGDDLMTPPDVLLQLSMKEAEKAANHDDPDSAIEYWIRATALARIVHGNMHWVLAKTHIQLARVYQQLKDLHEQALMHATKGRDILLSPSGHMTLSHDPDPESIYHLSLAHCIIGKAQTHLEKLPEAERAFIKAEKCSEKFSKLANSDIQLDLDIVTGMGQLSLKQKKYELAKDCFTKALDYTKAAHGTKSSNLIPLLRSLATAEIQTSNSREAIKLLEEALQIAEHRHGLESLPVAEVLMGLSRAHRVAADSKESANAHPLIKKGVIEEQIDRALSIYTSHYGSIHEATISCKDELCQYLSAHESSRTRAEEVIIETIVAKKKTFGETSQEVGYSYKLLGTVHLSGGKISQARKYLEKARHVYSLAYGAKHKETQSVARALEVIAESNGQTLQNKKPIFRTTV